MRNVNPTDLEQLAKLIDGRGGLSDRLEAAFTRAAGLEVQATLAPLKPLRRWTQDTAPDLRKRAAFARLEDGDPEAGLRWAGFSTADLEKFKGAIDPGTLLLANSVAASDSPEAKPFERQSNESLNDWIDRIKAHALGKIPGLQPHEGTIQYLLGVYGDWQSVTSTLAQTTLQGSALTSVLVGNAVTKKIFTTLTPQRVRFGEFLKRSSVTRIANLGEKIVKADMPALRSLAAPGSWFPGKLSQWAQKMPVEFLNRKIGARTGQVFDRARRLPFMRAPIWRGITANKLINGIVGSDALAKRFGGLTHSGQAVARAGNASLFKVTRNIYSRGRAVGWSRGTALTKGLAGASKVSGALRGAGIVGGIASTGFSAANVIAQGNPVEAFKKKGAGYVADVAEVGFNASLTASMIAPNPFTIGATVVFGGVYVGAKIVEHWDDVKAGAGKAVDFAKDVGHGAVEGAKKVGHAAVDGAKKAGHALNPKNWF
ncbi:PE-PGRS family protein [Streptomyces sp. NPDC047046]|uniref:PE-PGRS family protein n=1 Tax=Streptomyces sp. NPDC047046 TaxID=3155378 RepID=UPI0033FFECA5